MKRLAAVAVLCALAGLTAAANAQANTVDATCNGGSCAPWFNVNVSLAWIFQPTDPDSTSADCADATISDDGGHPLTCTATWNAGPETDSHSVDVKVDKTPPNDVAGLSRSPDSSGWYNHALSLDMSGSSDLLSGIASCTPGGYSGSAGTGLTMSGHCTDNAGNVGNNVSTPAFNYDATPPTIQSTTLARPADLHGWYNHPVALVLTATDNLSGVAACNSPSYSGPDSATAQLNGGCLDKAGNGVTGGLPLSYDATAPGVHLSPDRPPDHGGWYNHPVSFAATGTDAVSGVFSCTGGAYSGPQSDHATVAGSCTDNAGNVGFGSTSLRYDSTRPDAPAVQVTPGNHRVDVSWSTPSDARTVTLVRTQQGSSAAPSVIYAGTRSSFVDTKLSNGTKYSYTVADIDQAGNSTTKTVRAIPTASSLRPFVGSLVGSAPMLTWKKIKRARYYNVQLYFGKTKVLSKWPRTNAFQVPAKWHYKGKTFTLRAGHYRWYVWPGYGALSRHNYGPRIGRSSFRVG